MAEAGYLRDVVVILLAALLSVSLFQRLRLGAVLGYLVAGAVIGPGGFALVSEGESVEALAELGIVFLLFTVGLELPFERLRVIGARTFALGAAQVVVTAIAIAAAALALGIAPLAAVAIGAGLSLSSTAVVLKLLAERGQLTSRFGRTAFAVLLVQDLAVGPLLVIVLALGAGEGPLAAALGIAFLKMAVAVIGLLGFGRIVLRQAVWPVARLQEPELFAALTLLIVIGAGLITKLAGLSMAFGAFLAGMLLAETRYRLQVAAEILPFRGLLLGLFFMSIGMSLDSGLAARQAVPVATLVVALLLGKTLLIALLARLFALPWAQAINLGLLLSQGGEFAFVLLGAALGGGVIGRDEAQVTALAVALSMMATPFLGRLGRGVAQRAERSAVIAAEDIADEVERLRDHVVIAGFGRVGSAVAARLQAENVAYLAVDLDAHRIADARRRNLPVYYGDARRPEILVALHVENARAVVIAVDDPKSAQQAVALLHYIFPELAIYARAHDEAHGAELQTAGARVVVPELAPTGVQIANAILERPHAAATPVAGDKTN